MSYAFPRLSVAAITPFTTEGAVDYDAVQRLTRHLIDQGNEGIVISGTTGESPTITHQEVLTLIDAMHEAANGQAMLIGGAGTNNTQTTLEFITALRGTGKVDGIMTVAPYYNRPSQDGLIAHFTEAAKAAGDLPLLVYNIPGRTGVELTPETLLTLAQLPNVRGVKDAVGNMERASWLAKRKPDSFGIYSGDDSRCLPLLSVGGAGLVSVASHVVGRPLRAMIDAFFSGDVANATRLHLELSDLFTVLFVEPNPTPVKYALSLQGIGNASVRLPLLPASPGLQARIDTIMTPYI